MILGTQVYLESVAIRPYVYPMQLHIYAIYMWPFGKSDRLNIRDTLRKIQIDYSFIIIIYHILMVDSAFVYHVKVRI